MAEQENFDRKVRDKLKDQEMPVPGHLWENINKALPPDGTATGTSPWFWWIGSAVSIAVVSAVLYFSLSFSENNNTSTVPVAVNSTAADQKNTNTSSLSSASSSTENNTDAINTNKAGQNGSSASGNTINRGNSSSASNAANTTATNRSGRPDNTDGSNVSTNSSNRNSTSKGNNNSSATGGNPAVGSVHTSNSSPNKNSNSSSNKSNNRNGTTHNNTAGSVNGSSNQNSTQQNTNSANSTTTASSPSNTGDTTNARQHNGIDGTLGQADATGSSNPSHHNSTNGVAYTAGTSSAPANVVAPANKADQNSSSQNSNATVPGTIAAIDSTRVNTDNVAQTQDATTPANTNTSSDLSGVNAALTKQDSGNTDSTNVSPSNSDLAGGNVTGRDTTNQSADYNLSQVDSSQTTMDSTLAAVDSTKQPTQPVPSDKKEKQKKDKENKHLFSAEVYAGAGYGIYGLDRNPHAVYADSMQRVLMIERFDSGTVTNKLTLSIGISANYKLSERIEVHAGIRYQQYAQTYACAAYHLDSIYFAPNDTDYVNPLYHYTPSPYSGKEKTTFITVPIGITYHYAINDKISVYGKGAFELRLMKSSGWSAKDTTGNVYASGKPSASFNTGVYLAAGIQYRLTDRLLFFAEPNTSFTIQNMYGKSDLVKQRPVSVGLAVGLRMEF